MLNSSSSSGCSLFVVSLVFSSPVFSSLILSGLVFSSSQGISSVRSSGLKGLSKHFPSILLAVKSTIQSSIPTGLLSIGVVSQPFSQVPS